MTARAHPRTRAVATVASVATHGRVAIVAPVASAAATGHVATVAPVATPPAAAARAGIPVATLATRQIAVATANALMNKGSCHTFHSGHSRGTDIGSPCLFHSRGETRRGCASILSLGSGKCGKCGHSPLSSKAYQWPHEIPMWQLWPLAKIARPSTHLRRRRSSTLTLVATSLPRRQRGRDPPADR